MSSLWRQTNRLVENAAKRAFSAAGNDALAISFIPANSKRHVGNMNVPSEAVQNVRASCPRGLELRALPCMRR